MQNQPMSNGPAPGHYQRPKRRLSFGMKFMRIEMFTVLLGIALLVAAVALYAGLASPRSESKQINSQEYQAVFLNGISTTSGYVNGSLYFGHIIQLNTSYLVLNDVFFLTVAATTDQSQAANPQLTKLGCQQLHSPHDELVVNRSQVAFWENLQDSGKVVQAIKQFKQQNPKGPDCSTSASSTQSTTPTTTTPVPTTKKP